MTLPWREHPDARAELRYAARWYDDQAAGLGDRLADEVSAALMLIRTWPDSTPRYRDRQPLPQIRRKRIDVFPYGIIYFVRNDELVVIADAHSKRRPGYWKQRLTDWP